MSIEKDNTDGVENKGNPKKLEKLFILGFFSVLLAGTPLISQIFGAFLPVPLCMVFLIYGKRVGSLFAAVITVVLLFLHSSTKVTIPPVPLILYGLCFSLVIAEFVNRRVHPIRGFLIGGFSLFAILASFLFFSEFFTDFSIRGEVEKNVMNFAESFKKGPGAEALSQGGEGARRIQDIVDKPEVYVNEVMNWIPSAIFAVFFLSWWTNFYLVLRNDSVWRSSGEDYPFSLDEFVKFRVPDFCIWVLILALSLFLGGEYLLGERGVVIGINLLIGAGVFYFFQGFGLLMDLLKHMKIVGMVRTLIFLSLILFGVRSGFFLAFLGVLDNFKDFRKSFKKKNNEDEGDNL